MREHPLPLLLARGKHDLLLYQAGADPYRKDPYSPLDLGHEDLRTRDLRVFEFCRDHAIEAWEAANAAISQAKATPKSTATLDLDRDKHFNLLKGLIYCGCRKGAFVPHASGKLDSQGRPYRYYTCNQVIHNHSVARCLVRQISAAAVEESVVGLLGQMAPHPTLIETVLDFGKANAGGRAKGIGASNPKIGSGGRKDHGQPWEADHLGLRSLAKVAALPAQKQGAAFTALLDRWRIEPENSVSKKLCRFALSGTRKRKFAPILRPNPNPPKNCQSFPFVVTRYSEKN